MIFLFTSYDGHDLEERHWKITLYTTLTENT